MSFQGIVFELGACTLTEFDPDGVLTAQVDGLGAEPRTEPYELHHAFGFAARPEDPETGPNGEAIEGRACNLLVGRDGTEAHAWLAADPRFVENFPPLKKGSSAQYCARKSFFLLDGEDGTATLYAEYPDGSTAHLCTIGVDGNGDPILELVHGEGMALTFIDGKGILKNAAGDAYVEVGASGIVLNGNVKITGTLECNGASITTIGDVVSKTGVSLSLHPHPTAMGPSGPPTPTPTP